MLKLGSKFQLNSISVPLFVIILGLDNTKLVNLPFPIRVDPNPIYRRFFINFELFRNSVQVDSLKRSRLFKLA